MKYEKIRGKSVAECMMKLRSTYGSAAIILSTREVKEGGLLGSGLFSRRLYEIDFMIQEGGAARKSVPTVRSGRGGMAADVHALRRAVGAAGPRGSDSEDAPLVPPRRAGATEAPAADGGEADALERELAALSAGVPTELERKALDLLLQEGEATVPPRPRPDRAPDAGSVPAWRADAPDSMLLPAMSAPVAVGVPTNSSLQDGDDRFARTIHRIRSRLLSAQLSHDFTEHFLRKVDDSLSRVEKGQVRNVENRSLEKLAEIIRTVPDIAPPRGECRAVMLIGPTGCGKTTSLAKLAARYHIMESREVSIYSLDHYRLAATEQLKTYAGVMDVPFYAPFSPREFTEYLRRDGAELMLIDTSGIGYRDLHRLEQLREYVEACEVRLEKHLVLAANTNAAILEKILLAYDRIGFDKIILTKLDESDFLGAFVELADKYNRPFSFLMNGQDVPGNILEADALELARMVLQEGPGMQG